MDIFEQIQKGQLEEILHKAEMLGDEETINKAFCAIIEKGGKANVGEIREWKGGKFRKTPQGWEPVSEVGAESKDTGWEKYDEIRIQALSGKGYNTSAGSIKGTSKEISSLEDAKKKINEELIRGRDEHNFSYNKVKVKVTGWVKGVGETELGEFNMGVSGK